jgi:oxygen-independent coproporphyrinogen-3 oxidase
MAIPKKVRPLHYMTGLYIHIPFCRQACHYCNFHFSTQLKHINPLVDAICAEIDQQNTSAKPLPIHTIYFGGGSPSLLSPQQLHRIFEAIHRNFNTQNCVEITLEANPEDINPTNLQQWKALGINRLSLGIQSLNNEELQ